MGKQYTTAPILVNSNGDPIPQYLDITDKTDSPQGSFKPLTNETIQKVQLTGSKVEVIHFFNALAINDTELKSSGLIDLSKYRTLQVIAYSTLNQDVDLFFSPHRPTDALIWDGTQYSSEYRREKLLAANANVTYVINSRLKWLESGIDKMQITARCAVAPTSGSLTVVVLGVV